MANQEFYYFLNDLQARPKARRWWPTAIAICAVFGGIYGAAVGSAVGAVPGAADVIEIAAGVMAVICGIPAHGLVPNCSGPSEIAFPCSSGGNGYSRSCFCSYSYL